MCVWREILQYALFLFTGQLNCAGVRVGRGFVPVANERKEKTIPVLKRLL